MYVHEENIAIFLFFRLQLQSSNSDYFSCRMHSTDREFKHALRTHFERPQHYSHDVEKKNE